jgi:pyrrolysyl-tRNA synthetase-like protein
MTKTIDSIVKKEKKGVVKKVYNKNQRFFDMLRKIKLYTSRTGVLHGIMSIKEHGERGDTATITTHCGQVIEVRNSKNSRCARWLRNRWLIESCPKCKIPAWKLEKYSTTRFVKKRGK